MGLALGIMIVLLTLAVMNGMETEVFSKLKIFYTPAKFRFDSATSGDVQKLRSHIDSQNITYYQAIFRNAVLKKDEDFRFISIFAVDDLHRFATNQLGISLFNPDENDDFQILIGDELGYMLGLSTNDTCELLSPADINLVTGSIPEEHFMVSGIFNFDILEIDGSYAIISLEAGKKIFSTLSQEFLLLNQEPDKTQLNEIRQKFPSVTYVNWESEFESLVSAMKLEKIAYSFFGFIVIFISAFNLLSIMSMTVLRKVPQLGILMAMGMNSKRVSAIFFHQAILTIIAGSILGGISTWIVMGLNDKYHLIKRLFVDFPLSNFPLIISWGTTFFVIVSAGFIIFLAGLYPASRIGKLNPVEAIDYIK